MKTNHVYQRKQSEASPFVQIIMSDIFLYGYYVPLLVLSCFFFCRFEVLNEILEITVTSKWYFIFIRLCLSLRENEIIFFLIYS